LFGVVGAQRAPILQCKF